MSGFVAIINTDGAPVDRTLLEILTASLRFRGPDRQQVWVDGAAGLGHTLFRTTDEARYENQPASLDGRFWITGCIRIDAREELLHKLGLQNNIKLADTPDSHLVLHAFRAWGEQCLDHLLGDFSFVLWDSTQHTLFCARDRFGLRQLCFAQTGTTFIASNSVHSIRQYPKLSPRLSRGAIGDFLLFGDHRWGDRSRTAFAEISVVEPAHCLVLKQGKAGIRRYWDIPSDVPLLRYRRESEYVEHFQQLFKSTVADRLRMPEVAIALSGGLDSASIAATISGAESEHTAPSTLRPRAVLYDSIHPSDERYYVEQSSQHLKLDPEYFDGGAYPLLSPPVQTTSPLELYQPKLWLDFSRHVPHDARVLLSGNGGDELLPSLTVRHALRDASPVHVLAALFRLRLLYRSTPPLGTGLMSLRKRRSGRDQKGLSPYRYPDWINPDLEHELDLKQRWSAFWSNYQREPFPSRTRHPKIAKLMMTPDWNTDDIYMNCGFTLKEFRCPFLDPRLITLMMSLPALPWLYNKHLLRRAMSDKLPAAVLTRPKVALGNIHESLLAMENVGCIENFTVAADLGQFVDPIAGAGLPDLLRRGINSYVNLRPLLLNTWLEGLRI